MYQQKYRGVDINRCSNIYKYSNKNMSGRKFHGFNNSKNTKTKAYFTASENKLKNSILETLRMLN